MMKKIVCCLLGILFSIFCLSACGGASSDVTSDSKPQPTIAFVQNEITVFVGESVQAEVVTEKSNLFVFWTVRDPNLATISPDGVVTGLQEGQTICWAECGGERAICVIKIIEKEAIPMLSVSVPYENNAITLYKGDTLDLNAFAKLGDTVLENAQFSYEVSEGNVVSVENGKITANDVGNATITVVASHEGQSAFVLVSVNVINK